MSAAAHTQPAQPISIGADIARRRQAIHLERPGLAFLCGVAYFRLCRIESARCNPTADELRRIAVALEAMEAGYTLAYTAARHSQHQPTHPIAGEPMRSIHASPRAQAVSNARQARGAQQGTRRTARDA